MITAHFVTFLSPGTFVHEESTHPIKSWDIAKASEMAHDIVERHGATPFCFYFTTRGRTDRQLDSKEIKRSGRYFLGGKIETLAEVKKRNDPDERILRANMEGNGYKRIIVNTNSWKITQPFESDDTYLEWKPKPKLDLKVQR
jgi:hypothetical protein